MVQDFHKTKAMFVFVHFSSVKYSSFSLSQLPPSTTFRTRISLAVADIYEEPPPLDYLNLFLWFRLISLSSHLGRKHVPVPFLRATPDFMGIFVFPLTASFQD